MSEKVTATSLNDMTLEALNAFRTRQVQRKNALENVKKAEKGLTQEQQNELNSIALLLVDIDEAIEAKENEAKTAAKEAAAKPVVPAFTAPKGQEKMVHLSVCRGRRFNQLTGEEVSPRYTLALTRGEWRLFKKHYKKLGYHVFSVLHDPIGEATAMFSHVTKEE